MGFKINKVKVDLRSYPPYLIMGEPKVGKTTLIRDLILLNYKKKEKGLLISLGQEEGFLALDDLQYDEAKVWDQIEDINGNRGLVQIIDEVLETQDSDDRIELVCFDTFDELVDIAIQQVFEEHRDATGSYPKSINDALGGYSRGKERVNRLIKEQIARLREAHVAVFILAHTKVKSKNDTYSDVNYEMITNNLDSTYYNPIANMAQMIVNVVYKRQFNDISKKKKKTKNGEIVEQKGNLMSSQRMMVFCDDEFVDAGGRFQGLPKELPLSAENFMKAFEMGVKNSTTANEAELKERKQSEIAENNAIAEKASEDLAMDRKLKIVSDIKAAIHANQEAAFLKIKPVVSRYKIKGFEKENLIDVDIEKLIEIKNLLDEE